MNKFSLQPCIIWLLCLNNAHAVSVKLLEPRTNGTVDIAVIITPGAKIKGEAYEPLGYALQASIPGNVWVALLTDFLFTTPNPPQLDEGITEARKKLKDAGFHGNSIFLAGHSLGGVFVGDYGLSHGSSLSGVMLFASYLTRSHRLRDYPLPVLTISGDLDGLTRVTRIVDTFEELQNETKHEKNMVYTRPVIVMPGINHGHFASGSMPSNVKDHDIPVFDDVTFDSAHVTIAHHVTNFVVATIGQPAEHHAAALAGLEDAFSDTELCLLSLSIAKKQDINTNQTSTSITIAQMTLLGDLLDVVKVQDIEISEMDAVTYEPDFNIVNTTLVTVTPYSHVSLPFDPEDVSLYPQTPTEIQAIMKSYEGVKHLLPTSQHTEDRLKTCKQINMHMFEIAKTFVSDVSESRWIERGYRNITFHDDITSGSKITWLSSGLKLDYGNSPPSLSVTSYVLSHPVSDNEGKRSGSIHCKILSPYRALEWIYIDALK